MGAASQERATAPDPYAVLGLERDCTADQIRTAYRILARQHHPDLNPGSIDAAEKTRQLNAAYETLGDPDRREAHDRAHDARTKAASVQRRGKARRDIAQDVHLRIQEFLRGASLQVRVVDPATVTGPETYPLEIPPGTAVGARFRIARSEAAGGGTVVVRVRALPDPRFKVRGADLRCDLRISAQRAALGGPEPVAGATGTTLRVQVPRGIGRGEEIRVEGEGLPRPHGGRGDLWVRIVYRPEVKITRTAAGGRTRD